MSKDCPKAQYQRGYPRINLMGMKELNGTAWTLQFIMTFSVIIQACILFIFLANNLLFLLAINISQEISTFVYEKYEIKTISI